jgi:hypothetical protein
MFTLAQHMHDSVLLVEQQLIAGRITDAQHSIGVLKVVVAATDSSRRYRAVDRVDAHHDDAHHCLRYSACTALHPCTLE